MAVEDLVPTRLVNLASHPANPAKGWAYYNTTDNTVYLWDGTTWVDLGGGGGGGTFSSPSDTVVFTVSGQGTTFTKADYPNLIGVRVRGVGGGGGGGGCAATGAGQYSAGTGGSGGGYFERWLTAAELAASETVTVGQAGSTGAGAAGGAGVASSFGAHATGNGGNGGSGGGATSGNGALLGPAGATATGGDVNITGSSGGQNWASGTSNLAWGGEGGSTPLGAGGTTRITITGGGAGDDAEGYGAGGSGAVNGPGQGAAKAGGAGVPGIVIVDVYESVAVLEQEVGAWNALTNLYVNGFDDYNVINASSAHAVGRYRKIGDQVYVEGYIDGGNSSGNVVVATLPAGFRPTHIKHFTVFTQNGAKRATIDAAGALAIIGYTAEEWVSLESINFSTL